MNLKDKLTNMDIKEVFNTPKGKGIAAGLLLIVVVLIIAVVGTLAVPKSGDEDTNTVVKTETPPASQATTDTATATTDTATATTDTETVVTEYDLSGYKDPFKPFIASSINNGTTSGSTGSSTDSNNQNSSGNTSYVHGSLSLVRIVNQNGQRYATVSYQGQEYTVREGEQIAGSPFKVTDIGDGSISLLYGDDRLTLQLGDEITK